MRHVHIFPPPQNSFWLFNILEGTSFLAFFCRIPGSSLLSLYIYEGISLLALLALSICIVLELNRIFSFHLILFNQFLSLLSMDFISIPILCYFLYNMFVLNTIVKLIIYGCFGFLLSFVPVGLNFLRMIFYL